MNKTLNAILFLNFLFISQGLRAETISPLSNVWRCTAHDAANKEWIINSGYEITAINRAFDACKKESTLPSSCKTSKESCEVFVNGVSTRPMWRCIALDQTAKEWSSNVYSQRDDAALAAKAYCRQSSSVPDTCYINLIACKNLNSRE